MNTIEFQKSTAKELLAVKDRVRNLVNHWGEDGRYKEAVLKSMTKRFLPSKYIISSGFVVKQTATRGTHLSSTQIDLIVYDSSFPVLFQESDFVIVTPDAVRAIIEVKANLQNQNVVEVLAKANATGNFVFQARENKELPFFNGVFSYDGFLNIERTLDGVRDQILQADQPLINENDFLKFKVNHISFNQHWFLKHWPGQLNPPNLIYKIDDLSFSFFIGNLMDYLSGQSVIQNSNLWFPVDKSIEVRAQF